MTFSKLLDGSVGFSDSDLSLLSWLQSIPSETFSVPFEQKTLNVDVERLERPSLETSWTEHMLITPIKPKTFPHSVMPFTRPRSAADIMTRSLLPTLDGLAFGLSKKFYEMIQKKILRCLIIFIFRSKFGKCDRRYTNVTVKLCKLSFDWNKTELRKNDDIKR